MDKKPGSKETLPEDEATKQEAIAVKRHTHTRKKKSVHTDLYEALPVVCFFITNFFIRIYLK